MRVDISLLDRDGWMRMVDARQKGVEARVLIDRTGMEPELSGWLSLLFVVEGD